MDKKQELCNFVLNIRALMKKVQIGEEISDDDRKTIVNFYLEVVEYVKD
jgi:hypothetical protein